ncbi:hypothetical protein FB45DRAFT_1017355 [Roridomyces roridus]|uniref:Uncharacterized protein n=1 Tax=Roridomyces roridus TaxID=1738132 RepID=A0AAD7FY51_9AGAR|nr:hypothetical protein FB45DRAFT_1017355 [Roridomyces roridus]
MALLPALAHLQCLDENSQLVAHLFNFLARNPDLVPNLSTLEVNNLFTGPFGATDVLDALALVLVRHRRLQTVRLTIGHSTAIPPDHADLAIFQHFLADGMDIHIGMVDGPNILLSAEPQEELAEEDEEDQI